MRLLKLVLILVFIVGFTSLSKAKGYLPAKIYMFGFAASFNDSTVYFTDIQEVNAYVNNDRNHFLVGRSAYSFQLRNYLQTSKRSLYPTCVTVYATTKAEINKKYLAIKKKYLPISKGKAKGTNRYFIETIPISEFAYSISKPIE
ncbi:hypothetical protein ABVC71_08855 [Prevotella amnii]|jgi:hypothetical protein|uniref:Uncharacterized protein n=2 Tax=Prevotella amnii TaxID=419005 RepID=A0A096D4V3_9BACT|nr:hypothetical protein [Prevotella amnii]EFN90761.1 hypothetical protein HMPREF9018_2014 [Prevotella amnii CRIS 21A-A]KGF52564.1 hypothetical protein HMPREF9302_03055 [Prevotella amnii DNF00058]